VIYTHVNIFLHLTVVAVLALGFFFVFFGLVFCAYFCARLDSLCIYVFLVFMLGFVSSVLAKRLAGKIITRMTYFVPSVT